MMEKRIVKNEIEIQAAASKVWDILTKSEYTRAYMFGCDVLTDWKPGSELLWQGEYEGQKMIFVSGHVLDIKPFTALSFTVIDPNAGWEMIPANYLNVHYTLKEENGKTHLTVMQDGFEGAVEGEKRYQDVYNNGEGWNPILVQIKQLAEGV